MTSSISSFFVPPTPIPTRMGWMAKNDLKIQIKIPVGQTKEYYKPKLYDYAFVFIKKLQDNFEVLKTDTFFKTTLEDSFEEFVQNSIDSVNERRHTANHIIITVRAFYRPEKKGFQLQIIDNGKGFPNVKKGKFASYEMLNIKSTKDPSHSLGGSGFALSAINTYIKDHEGSMYIGNLEKSPGACIQLSWPIKPMQEESTKEGSL